MEYNYIDQNSENIYTEKSQVSNIVSILDNGNIIYTNITEKSLAQNDKQLDIINQFLEIINE